MARIQTASPPETTFEGQLQRMRDRNRAREAGEDDDVAMVVSEGGMEEEEDVMLDVDDAVPDEPPPPPVRRRLVARAATHRQPPPAPSSAPSWWLQHPTREGFTSAGEKATEQSRHRKEAAGIGLGSLAKE